MKAIFTVKRTINGNTFKKTEQITFWFLGLPIFKLQFFLDEGQ